MLGRVHVHSVVTSSCVHWSVRLNRTHFLVTDIVWIFYHYLAEPNCSSKCENFPYFVTPLLLPLSHGLAEPRRVETPFVATYAQAGAMGGLDRTHLRDDLLPAFRAVGSACSGPCTTVNTSSKPLVSTHPRHRYRASKTGFLGLFASGRAMHSIPDPRARGAPRDWQLTCRLSPRWTWLPPSRKPPWPGSYETYHQYQSAVAGVAMSSIVRFERHARLAT